jgi:hypothetical protein
MIEQIEVDKAWKCPTCGDWFTDGEKECGDCGYKKMDFKVGDHFKINRGLPKDPPHKCHVLAIVDENYVVFKWYGRHKQWWHYQVEHRDVLEAIANRYINE